MKVITGDLIDLALKGYFKVIIHGCNCFCTMEAGVALAIKKAFPEAYQADLKTLKGDKNKLGSCSIATYQKKGKTFDIVNAYTQYHWSSSKPQLDYSALISCFKWIKQNYPGQKIAFPKIGAGLAGGDWVKIESIITRELYQEDITLIVK